MGTAKAVPIFLHKVLRGAYEKKDERFQKKYRVSLYYAMDFRLFYSAIISVSEILLVFINRYSDGRRI